MVLKKRLEAAEKAATANAITEAAPAVLLIMPDNGRGDPRPTRRGRVELHVYDPITGLCGCGGSHPNQDPSPA